MIPFTAEQFLALFARYNLAIWPLQIIFYFIGAAAILLLMRHKRGSDRIVSAILSFLWLWNGIAYHFLHFSQINRAAVFFGILFVVQAILFAYFGVIKGEMAYGLKKIGPRQVFGLAVIAYAMGIYPVLGALAGHGFPFSPMFGVAPCPTTIFTFGLFLLTTRSVASPLLVIPLFWSVIGFGAALSLGITEDIGLIVVGVSSVIILVMQGRRVKNIHRLFHGVAR
ncbi:MAG TPA: DUF6064 family protein [Syntrophorhabdaceae bacterium]